jgi:hypothetical protein
MVMPNVFGEFMRFTSQNFQFVICFLCTSLSSNPFANYRLADHQIVE